MRLHHRKAVFLCLSEQPGKLHSERNVDLPSMSCGVFGQNGSNKRSIQTYSCALSSLRKRRFWRMSVLRKTQHPNCQKRLRYRQGCRWRSATWSCRSVGRRNRCKQHPVCLSLLRSKMEQITNPSAASAVRGSFPFRSTDRNIFLPASLDTVPILHHRNTRKEASP